MADGAAQVRFIGVPEQTKTNLTTWRWHQPRRQPAQAHPLVNLPPRDPNGSAQMTVKEQTTSQL
jgi:hypothetical protein